MLLAAGCVLLVVNVWFVRHAIDGFKPRALPDTIAPIHIVGVEDKDGRAGQALAGMLLARMRHIGAEMAATHEQLERPLAERAPTGPGLVLPQDLRSPPLADLPTGLSEPVNFEMKVAGVEVGGMLSWVHRSLTSDNALQLTLQNGNGEAVVSGTWNEGRDTLWVEVPGAADKLVPNERVVKSVAYALMQRQFERRVPQVSALSPAEFETFVTTMSAAATRHRQAMLGGSFQPEFAALSEKFETLVSRAPNWKELLHFAARVAELGGKVELALDRYKQTLALLDKGSDLREPIETRVMALTDRLLATAPRPVWSAAGAGPQFMPTPEAAAKMAAAKLEAAKLEKVEKGAVPWPLKALGVAGLDMPETVRVAVLGGPPTAGTLRAEQFEVVGPSGSSGSEPDRMMADYVRNIVQTVLMVAPGAHFIFAHSQSRNGAATEGQILAELALLAKAKPAVALLTLGPLRSAAYARVFEQMAADGTLVVMAAGNEPQRPMLSLGDALDEQVLIVSSVGPSGKASTFTQRGNHSVWAPGENIPIRSADPRVDTGAGTSYAAALAAGVAARLVAERPKLGPRELRNTLTTTAQPQASGGPAVLNLARAREKLG